MNDMYEKGYQDGYLNGHKDGFQKGWEENRRQKEIVQNPFDNKCPKCQMTINQPSSGMAYVCPSVNCPFKSYATS